MQMKSEITDDLIDKAGSLLGITEKGSIIFKFDRTLLSVKDQVLLLLAGYMLAYQAKLRESPSATLKEITRDIIAPPKVVRARLSELVKLSVVSRSEAGVYEIGSHGLRDIVERVTGLLSSMRREG